MPTPTEFDIQLEHALCRAGVPQSIAYELSRLLPVVRRDASGASLGLEIDGVLDEGVPAGGTTGQVLTKQSGADGDADWATPSGAGLGDFSSNTATSVDSEIMLFSGTGGKTGKRATTTGLLKAAAGVLAAAVAGTDYLAPAAIGVTVQAYDADLAALAGVTSAADALPYFTGAGTAGTTTLTAFGRSLIDDADASAGRTTLGLGTIATQAAASVAITGGSITGITDLAIADGGTGASSASAARTSLGLEIGTNVQAYAAGLTQIGALADPNADRLLFWDDSVGSYAYLTLGTNLSITGTTLDATGGGGITVQDEGTPLSTAADTLNFVGAGVTASGTGTTKTITITGGGATALDDLSDVAITTPAAGHVIRHNGTNFVNVLGTDHFQAADAGLLSIAGLTTAADRGIYTTALDTYAVYTLTAGGRALAGAAGTADTFPYFSASNTVSLASITAAGRSLLDDADGAAQLATMGGTAALGSGGVVRGTSPTITTPTFSGLLTMGAGAQVTTANAMTSQAINVANALNTETNAVDRTFTFTGTPTTGQVFTAYLTNSDTAVHLYTLPTCIDISTGTSAAHVIPVAGGGKAFLAFRYNGSAYELLNRPGYLNKFDATADPTTGDDVADGYGPGSLWGRSDTGAMFWCESNGAGAAVWNPLAGNVTKVGTPANNQVGVWTGDGTLEGDAALSFDTTTDLLTIGAGSLTRAGAHALTLTTSGTTNVTLPTSGTLAALAADANFNTLTVNTNLVPDANDGAGLGTATLSFADLFLASGAVLNFANGDWVATHSTGILTVGTGDLRVTTAGTNAASVVTVGGTQTLTNKTLTSPGVGTSILDTNGNELIDVTATASAVNQLGVVNAATGNAVQVTTAGGDTNISLNIVPKGTGELQYAGAEMQRHRVANSQSAAYTTVLADRYRDIVHPSADTTARTFTIDSNANVPYPVGTRLVFRNQNGAGVLTIAITSDTMRLAGAGTTGSRTLAADGVAVAVKEGTTSWYIDGVGLT